MALSELDPWVDMDVIGAIEGSDKSSTVSFSWDYLKHFEPLFVPFRDAPINLLEVGVQSGPSVRLWEWYFSQATIVGIDINPACRTMAGGRVAIEIGSQADAAFLHAVCAKYPPSIFIDDGSHLATHNIFTFEQVFPLLAPGGLYIVEDLAIHFGAVGKNWHGTPPRDAPGYFLELAKARLARSPIASHEHIRPALVKMIDSIQIINSAVILRKAHPGRDVAAALRTGRGYVQSRPSARTWLGYSAYILKQNGGLNQAADACEAAMREGGRSLAALTLLAEIKWRQGEKQHAHGLLTEAAGLAHGAPLEGLIALAAMEAEAGRTAEAIARLEQLAQRVPGHPRVKAQLAKLRA
jgi:hypothetical protein